MKDISGYTLSRAWFDFSFENPEKVRPIHSAIYFFAVEHCNRLGWKEKFGFPSQMAMEAIGIRNWRTYSKALNELVEFGFIIMIEKSKNQWSSNVISIKTAYVKNTKAPTKALDKALQKHGTKQVSSTVSIDKQTNKEQTNKEQDSVITLVNDVPSASDSNTWESAIRVANRLLESIQQWDNTHRYNSNPPSIESWVKDIDRAIRLDGRTEEQLNWIIDFLFTKNHRISNFWASNIQSGKKLREQFDKIKNQIKNETNHGKHSEIDRIVNSMYQ